VNNCTHDLLNHLLGGRWFPCAYMVVILVVDQIPLLDVFHNCVLHSVEEIDPVKDQDDVLVGVVPKDFYYF